MLSRPFSYVKKICGYFSACPPVRVGGLAVAANALSIALEVGMFVRIPIRTLSHAITQLLRICTAIDVTFQLN